jgi:osmoprotectant transport system ATP-binding protein
MIDRKGPSRPSAPGEPGAFTPPHVASRGTSIELAGVSKRFARSGRSDRSGRPALRSVRAGEATPAAAGVAAETWAVRDVSLRIASGELVALLGESGSGKTTLLRMVNRLVEPDQGSVSIDGRDVQSVDATTLRRGIGYVIQQAGLFPHLTVGDNVAVVPQLVGWPAVEISARVDELLALVGLPPAEYRERFPDELSGGQRQRVGVARALAARPKVLLLDEPFGALDPITRASLQGELKKIHRELGLTTIMVTHDLVEALTLADRIAVLYQGELRQLGTPAELVEAPADEYVAKLMQMARHQAQELARSALAG